MDNFSSEWSQIENAVGKCRDECYVSSFRISYEPDGTLSDVDFSFYNPGDSSLYRLEKINTKSYQLIKSKSQVSDFTKLLQVQVLFSVLNQNMIKKITPKDQSDTYTLVLRPNLQQFNKSSQTSPVYQITGDSTLTPVEQGSGFLINVFSMKKTKNGSGGSGTASRYYVIL
jgi:hypothetical protein